METQTRKHKWLKELQREHKAPILMAGDLFNYHKPSPFLLSWSFRNLADGFICIPGQHDLPAHNMDNIGRSGIQVLADGEKINLTASNLIFIDEGVIYQGFPWGVELRGIEPSSKFPSVALIHYGVYESKPHYPGAENSGGTAKAVLRSMPGFDLIVSGDNHLTFTQRLDDRVLVNPGSFMRSTAAQADHKPCVFLWCAETNEVEQVFIPIEKDVISREHIEAIHQRDERLESFISKLDHDIELGISYTTNMRNHLAKNKIPKSITDIIWGTFR
jgi:DNA repair exonuclease SbcCD nuclease subunit